MSKLYFVILWLFPLAAYPQIWSENFDGLAEGTTARAGMFSWTSVAPSAGAGSFAKMRPYPGYELFVANDTGTEGIWQSEVVDISGHSEVAVEVALYSYFTYSSDYIKCYYKLDGGSEVLFGELLGSNGLSITSAASAIVRGSSLQIIIKAKDNTSGTTSGVIRGMGFDDISLSSITYLYSRSSGNWGNSNTWSEEGYNGASCGCTPDQNTHVFIGNNRNVTLNSVAQSAGVSVENTGRINYAANYQLNIVRGGVLEVAENGVIDKNNNNGSSVAFSTYNYQVKIEGNLSVGGMNINSDANVSFSGRGNLDISNDLNVGSGLGETIVNDISGTFSIGDDLNFLSSSSGLLFINNGVLNVANRILINADNVSLLNKGSVNASSGIVVNDSGDDGNVFQNEGTLSIGTLNLNNGDFTLNNSGIINQSGDFLNVAGGSYLNNLSNAVWNYGGTTTCSRLFINTSSSLFNYNRPGDQAVSAPADGAYYNLLFSGSGTKSLTGNLLINADLQIDGNAAVDPTAASYSVELKGNWLETTSTPIAFLPRNAAIVFSGSSGQTISCATGGRSFYDLAISKSSGNVQLSSTALSVLNTLSLVNGGLDLNGNDVNILNQAPAAIARTSGFIKSETSAFPYSMVNWSIGSNAGSFTFPFGLSKAGEDYIPFVFDVNTAGMGSSGVVSVATYATGNDNLPFPEGVTTLTRNGADNSDNVVDRFWQIDLSGYTGNPTATLTFTATPDEVAGLTDLRVQHWNSESWDPPVKNQINPTLYSAKVSGVSDFSPWTVVGDSAPLPVELEYFDAVVERDIVNLEWKTGAEHNSDYFTIEKTKDFESFEEVAIVKSAGNGKPENIYRTTDPNPINGISYYRLKQTDSDGKDEYFRPVMVKYYNTSIRIFPNPVPGSTLTVSFPEGIEAKAAILEVVDAQGITVFSTEIDEGLNSLILNFDTPLKPGIYFLKSEIFPVQKFQVR